MNRLVFATIVRTARITPAIRFVAPRRLASGTTAPAAGSAPVAQSSQSSNSGAGFGGGVAGGLTVLLGGFAWYHFSGTRQVVNVAQEGMKQAQELKEKVKDKAGDAAGTVNYLRSATATLIPGSAPFLGKVFDQIEKVSEEHGDEVKKIFDETYKDFEKLAKQGGLDSQTASKAVDILQKRVKEIQDLAGDVGGDVYEKFLADNPQMKDKFSDQYKNLKEIAEKAKDKSPEIQKIFKDVPNEVVKIAQKNGMSKESVKEAQDLLKKKTEEAKKLFDEVSKKK